MGWAKIPKGNERNERPATFEDLREYVDLLEELGGRRFRREGQGYKGHALHRPDRNPSLHVFLGYNSRIMVYDFSWRRSWSYSSYLWELGREDLAQAWRERFEEWDPTKDKGERRGQTRKGKDPRLAIPEARVEYPEITPSTDEWEATARAKMEEALEAVLNGEHPETLRYMEKRGLTPELAYAAGLGAVKEGIAIPIYDEDLRPKNVKVRRHDGSKGERFFYVFPGRGNGYYFSPDFAWRPMRRVIIVEGETNAAAVYDALGVPAIGVPGAGTGLSLKLVDRLKEDAAEVVILTDQDDAGRRLMEKMKDQLVAAGYDTHRIFIPVEDRYGRDPMDILKDQRLEGLEKNLKERIYNRAARLKKGRTVARGLALAVPEDRDGLNTKRSLALAIGHSVARRHASYVPPEEKEAMRRIENYLTWEAMKRGAPLAHARKAVRKWMDENGVGPRSALFALYEYNEVKTGTRELNPKFIHQRQHHPLFGLYRIYGEKMNIVGFDIARLLEDAVEAILGMMEEVISYFRKLKERIDEERRKFAEWIRNLPHLLGYIVRRKTPAVEAPSPKPVAVGPPAVAAA